LEEVKFINRFLVFNLSDEHLGRIFLLVLKILSKMNVYQIIETAKRTGKIEKGTNEVTKAIERGTAKFVAYATDVEPKEIVQHIPVLCKEKNIPCQEADSKQKLGIASGLAVSASSIAVIELGEAEAEISSSRGK